MAAVDLVEPEDAPERLGAIYDELAARAGLVKNLYKALGHQPDLLESLLNLEKALETTRLDPELRELAILATSELNGCNYDRSYHHAAARRAGLSERHVQDLDQPEASDAYDGCQQEVIRYARQMTSGLRVDLRLFQQLRRRFSERELVELTAAVALANFTNRIISGLRIDLP